MIFGIGCDLCEIDRIEKAGERFLKRYFSENEQRLFASKKSNAYFSAAANFAAKEAFSKALGTGVRGFALEEVEVLRDDMGKPYINPTGAAEKICRERGIGAIFVSLSHTGNMAMAQVVLERQQ